MRLFPDGDCSLNFSLHKQKWAKLLQIINMNKLGQVKKNLDDNNDVFKKVTHIRRAMIYFLGCYCHTGKEGSRAGL